MTSQTVLQLANLLLANTLKASARGLAAAIVMAACLAAAGLFLLLAFYNVLVLFLPAWGAFLVLAGLFLSIAGAAHLYRGRLQRIAQQRRASYLQAMTLRASALLHVFDAVRKFLPARRRP